MNFESEVVQVHLEDIIPNRFQPRLSFDEQGIKELADSIKEHGIIQPLVLRKLGDKYEIIAGERRFKAATMAGLSTVPAVISSADDNQSAEVALVENVQRRDLTPIEEARSYKNLLDKGYLTQEQLAKRMGLSQSAVANKLRLLNLDDEVQQALLNEQISERHARALLAISDHEAQKEWLHRIINERMTVRQLDSEIKKINSFDTLEEDIPLVESDIDFDKIRESTRDLHPVQDSINPSAMMMPEDVMTEFSDSVEAPKTEYRPTIVFNPLNTSQSVSNNNSNKFFNFDIPDSSLKLTAEEANLVPPSVEIFDAPTMTSQSVGIDHVENKLNTTPNLTTVNSSFSDFALNSSTNIKKDNKFFTVANADQSEDVPDIKPQIVDPITAVDNLNSNIEEDKETDDFGSIINELRSVVNSHSNYDRKISIEEADLLDKYQIIINIEK